MTRSIWLLGKVTSTLYNTIDFNSLMCQKTMEQESVIFNLLVDFGNIALRDFCMVIVSFLMLFKTIFCDLCTINTVVHD